MIPTIIKNTMIQMINKTSSIFNILFNFYIYNIVFYFKNSILYKKLLNYYKILNLYSNQLSTSSIPVELHFACKSKSD